MAGKVRYLILRDGRYHARVVVPPRLRSIIGKVELSTALGPDRREAIRNLPKAIAGFQEQLAEASRQTEPKKPQAPRAPSDPLQAARARYDDSIAFDTELRDATPLYARFGYQDEDYIENLKRIAAGSVGVEEIKKTFRFNLRSYGADDEGQPNWRLLTRMLAQAELAAMEVTHFRNEGEPDPPVPAFLNVALTTVPKPAECSASIRDVFIGYRTELQRIGKGRNAASRWEPSIDNLVRFVGHDVAARITRRDSIRWKDELLKTLGPKTVRDSYLATARAAFAWAADNLDITQNPFAGVKVRLAKKVMGREKGFQEGEAVAILKASREYSGSAREHETMTGAKQWTPILAAYTGARIGELTQLRGEDVKKEGTIHYIRITPEAGTVKSGLYRDVPLHPHIVEAGFLEFCESRGTGPLFYRPTVRRGRTLPAGIVAARIAKWIRSLNLAGIDVQPNHGWRHRMKTVGREAGMDPRVLDAIQGHAPRTAGDNYGDVTLKTKHTAIVTLPRYQLQ